MFTDPLPMKLTTRFAVLALCSLIFFTRGKVFADDATFDVTTAVQQAVQGDELTVIANDSLGGDPAPTIMKRLKVDYTINGTAESKVVMEYGTLTIRAPKGEKLAVTKAVYGDLPNEQKVDVTGALNAAIHDNKISVPVTNETFGGDPAPNNGKRVEVNYSVDGKVGKTSAGEAETLALPLTSDKAGKLVILSAYYGVF